MEVQELESAAILGLLDAAQKFDPKRGVGFPTYAEHRIIGSFHKLLMQLRGAYIVSLETLGVHESPGRIEVPLGDTPDPNTSSPHDILLKSETKNILARAVESLLQKQRLVLLLYYCDELTMREIGQVPGVNESRDSQHHSTAMRNLRGKLRWTKTAA